MQTKHLPLIIVHVLVYLMRLLLRAILEANILKPTAGASGLDQVVPACCDGLKQPLDPH